MRKADNKQRLFEVMSKVDKTFKYDLNEISTGLAHRAADTAIRDKWSGANTDITQRKGGIQADKFASYINPELKRYVMQKFSDVEGFEMTGTFNLIRLSFPVSEVSQGVNTKVIGVDILIYADKYEVKKVIVDTRYDDNKHKDYESGGSELLSQKHISILPTIIKRIQADMNGEKSQYNPVKPEPMPEPEPVAEPVQQEPVQKTGFLNKLKNRFN
jgi:hypothetical protein